MKFSLSVLERLMVLSILPSENNIVTLKVIRKIKEIIGFSDDELKTLGFQTIEKDGKTRTTWDNKAAETVGAKEFELSEKAVDIIADALKKLNEQKKLTESHLSIYEKVIENVDKI